MAGVFLLFLSAVLGASAQILNPDLKLVPQNPALEGKPGVVRIYKSPTVEVHLKSTSIPDAASAERAVEVSYGLIKGLYQPKKNPYAGEVTALVQCDKKFAPREFSVKCGTKSGKALAGGAGERHAFGMCAQKDIREVAVFFSCYDSGKKELLEVRLFLPFEKGKAWSAQLKDAKKLAAELLQ